MNCLICSSPMSEPVQELFALPTVASDCRPWSTGRSVQICSGCGVMKRVTNENFDHDVYKNYTSYPEPTGRTKKILDFVSDRMAKPQSVLDIGCGKGDGLQILQTQFPLAKVSGYEPTIHKDRPSGKYDLITLFHVFEHVEDLHEMLSYIKSSLTENGHVFIQVPYAIMWPFDLIIADHEWHFSVGSIIQLVTQAGFNVIYGGNDIIQKEITILAELGMPDYRIGDSDRESKQSKHAIDWLLNFKKKLDAINEPVIVYGTSVSAMWAGNILGDKVLFYIDDDKNRHGEFNGKKVYGVSYSGEDRIGALYRIVAPFLDWQLEEIKAKHPNLRFI